MEITIVTIIIAYICGSISSAILICRFKKLPDPRTIGSKNPGTTNISRINKKIAIIVLLLDILKGAIPMWLAQILNIPTFWLGTIPIVTCMGHIYPIFFKFCGGKGMATAFGALTTISLNLSGLMFCIWSITVLLSGFASLGSIITLTIIPFYTWLFYPQYALQITILAIIILIQHQSNAQRLINGRENNIWKS
ncbi:glycerol-3-phosphate 1-O-acyltransferase PlsY [Blochmannia endosymbiont of Camponotus (Colobopsis) obliquus]|uniref:glycerol-3-phosphate 1-O-acyltransferase PlsY n=1 Tax=Blochmannia endosymbiont of Camponotus (Colobopsis) obliquus TaxID=1505597 RepID=UPI00061A8086|nr:glycerol-3-phosphate 1-O-acyltransferase PlsY [Blochmannia endosymbiont of Camponotus (Colobopsis) obliquus]AKC60241.1 putative glycerol-3-phosphate acyltransferase [Blochmannia endosymbiont of Camponotus (Colobopsis) obliquus]